MREPALRRIGLTHVSASLTGSIVLFPKRGHTLRFDSRFLEARVTLPFTSVLDGFAPVTASGVDCGITSPALISFEDKTYNRDLGCQSLRSAAPWHTLGRTALLGEPRAAGWRD